MFKRVQKSFFRVSRVSALIFVLSVVAQSALAFELDTNALLSKTDHFSLLKKTDLYTELNLFWETCSLRDAKDCISNGKKIYLSPKHKSFQPLVAKKIVKRVAGSDVELSTLSFLDPALLGLEELELLMKSFTADQVLTFLGEEEFERDNKMGSLLVSKPNLICKFSKNEALSQKLLSLVKVEINFYQKDFSDFPCGLKLDSTFDNLLSEIAESKKKTKFKRDYLYSFLRKKVSRDAYRAFPRYRKSGTVQRARLQWKRIKAHLPYIQTRIIRNLFYAGKYKMLATYTDLSKNKKPKLEPDSLVYVVKSLAALQKGDELLQVSEGLKWSSERWAEEILLMRASAYLRKSEFSAARVELTNLINIAENLKLSGLYWTWVSFKKDNNAEASKTTAEALLKFYPFTYFGLRVAKDLYGPSFFDRYTKQNFIKQNFDGTLTKEEQNRLEYFYTYEKRDEFKKEYFRVKEKLNPKQKSLMSLVFANLDHQIEVIRALNKVWDEEEGLRATPFVSTSFPLPYKKVSTEISQDLKWVSPSLIHAVIRQESAFNKEAKSSANAMGLMQLLPSTAQEVARRSKNKKYKRRSDLFKPEVNIALGANYLNRLINASKGYLPYAFASYNAGPGRMYKWSKAREDLKALRSGEEAKAFDPLDDLWVEELPWSETRFYTKALLRNTGIYLALMNDKKALKCAPFWRCHRDSL